MTLKCFIVQCAPAYSLRLKGKMPPSKNWKQKRSVKLRVLRQSISVNFKRREKRHNFLHNALDELLNIALVLGINYALIG